RIDKLGNVIGIKKAKKFLSNVTKSPGFTILETLSFFLPTSIK
ncbi:unnamed protein product, partial [marine sediment metagenome]